MDNNWKIIPIRGLGLLNFDLSSFEVGEFSMIYGKVIGGGPDRIPDMILVETLEQFGSGISDEEKQNLLDLYKQTGPSNDSFSEVRDLHGITLRYEKDKLSEITINKNANIDNKLIFDINPKDSLILFERLNKKPGLYRGTGAFFDNLAIILDGFSDVRNGDTTKITEVDHETYDKRTINLHHELYSNENEREFFHEHSLF